ncbi:MAG: hypothetical protein ACREAK_00985 [Nitrosarchaeum sp.]
MAEEKIEKTIQELGKFGSFIFMVRLAGFLVKKFLGLKFHSTKQKGSSYSYFNAQIVG